MAGTLHPAYGNKAPGIPRGGPHGVLLRCPNGAVRVPLTMKNLTAEQVAAKWSQRASNAASDYAAGIAAVTSNPLAKAAQSADLWQQRVNDPSVKAKFVRKLNAFPFDQWKAIAAQYGQSRYSQGVSSKTDKYATAIAPVLAYEAAGLAQIESMPKVTLEDRIQRSAAWQRYMAAYAGRG